MAVVLFPFTFIRLTKFRVAILFIFFPILAYVVDNYLFSYIMASGFLKEDSLEMATFMDYSQIERTEQGLGAKLERILGMLPLYATTLYLVNDSVVREKQLDNLYIRLLTYAFGILYCSSLFAFIKAGSDVFYYRYMYMMYIPLILCLASYLGRYGMTKFLTITCSIAAFAQFYQLLYSLYIAIVG